MDKPETTRVLGVREHSPVHRTFVLDREVDARPGQFCMLWIPGVNEKPMSFSGVDGKAEVTVKKRGTFTSHLFMLDAGDEIGFRGPYGTGFEYVAGDVCVVGGGCGIAPLRPLKDRLRGHVVLAARDANSLLFVEDFQNSDFKVHVATDDGSAGEKALAHEVLAGLLEDLTFTCVYCCGPEPMMKKVLDVCLEHDVPSQFSLERHMKCGVGLCGSCTIAGHRVCKEGPVFRGRQLAGTEFGSYTRDASGSRRALDGSC